MTGEDQPVIDPSARRVTQWLAAALLTSLAATVVLAVVLRGFDSRLTEHTDYTLVSLQAAGLLHWIKPEYAPATILRAWKARGVLDHARRAQQWDFAFAIAYGTLGGLLAVALWRAHPDYPRAESGWVIAIATISFAAVCDEVENVCLYFWVLLLPEAPSLVAAAVASLAALAKTVCLLFGAAVLLAALLRPVVRPRA